MELSKNLLGIKSLFEKPPVLPLLIKLAALSNLKATFHCAHWHRFFPFKKAFFENPPVLPYP